MRPPLVLALVGTGGALRQQGGYGTREDQMGGIEGRFAHLVLEALEAPLTDPR